MSPISGADHDAARRTVWRLSASLDGATVRDVLLQSLHVRCRRDRDRGHDPGAARRRRRLGERALGVLHEHFVSSSFRGVLGDLRMPVRASRCAPPSSRCPPNELHDLPLGCSGRCRTPRLAGREPGGQHPDGRRRRRLRFLRPTPACSPGSRARLRVPDRRCAGWASGCRSSSLGRARSPCPPRSRASPCCRAT